MIYLTGGHSLKREEKNPLEAICSVLRGSCQPFSSAQSSEAGIPNSPSCCMQKPREGGWLSALVLGTLMRVNESVRTPGLKE